MGLEPYIILPAALGGMLILLLIPVSLTFDSREKTIEIGWLSLSITKSLTIKNGGAVAEKEKKWTGRIAKAMARLFGRNRSLYVALLHGSSRAGWQILRSLSIREVEATFSTSDPMWNGILGGVLVNTRFRNVTLSVNFQGDNYLRGVVRLHPYSALTIATRFLFQLPYRRIIRTVLIAKEHQ